MHKIFLPACALLLFSLCLSRAEDAKLPFADGVTDATAPIQAMLDSHKATGSEVFLPPGQYLIKGSLTVPHGVTLRGSWDEPHHGNQWQVGTTLLLTGGAGQEDGPAAIELEASAAVKGLTLLWPEQKAAAVAPYPWAIHGRGNHNTVENVTLVNAYQGIKMGGPGDGSLHLIRNVFGCVLRRGIMVDNTTDIGRIENVHFNPHYWGGSGHPSKGQGHDFDQATAFLKANLEGFIFARSDWEYVTNTFIWGAKSGYLFIKTKGGNCNGQFLGIGADYCQACVRIDDIQPFGLAITNGEFTAFAGDPNSAIVTSPGAGGAVQLVNCSFWGVKGHTLLMQGDTAVTLSDSHIFDVPPGGAILAEKGKLIVHGCNFEGGKGPAVVLKPGVKAAIVAENLQPGGVQIDNGIGSRAVIGLNQMPEEKAVATASPTPK